MYELLTGKPPFDDINGITLKDQLISSTFVSLVNDGVTSDGNKLIVQLLEPNPKKRIGSSGIHHIKKHSWFLGNRKFNWSRIVERIMESPIKCYVRDTDDIIKNFFLFSNDTLPTGLADLNNKDENEEVGGGEEGYSKTNSVMLDEKLIEFLESF